MKKLQKDLNTKIIEKYHLLLPNDNVKHILNNEDFKIQFKNSANEN